MKWSYKPAHFVLTVVMALACAKFVMVTAQDGGLPHLDLVRGLRERGHHDLALEYLEGLVGKQALLAPETRSALPLELARSRAEVAAQLPTGAERDALLQKSRGDLEAFLKTNPPGTLHHEAELALAGTLAEQARSLALAANRAGISEEKPPQKAIDLHKASVTRFDEADKVFAILQKKLEDQQSVRPGPPTKSPGKTTQLPATSPLHLATLYFRAQARYDKSRLSGLGVRDAGLANDEAKQLAEKLAAYRANNAVGWQGYALYARTLEGGDDARATAIYRQIEGASSPLVFPAQRMVRYFPLARADATGEVGEQGNAAFRTQLRNQAERWLQLYGHVAGSTRDAQHVRYILIRLYAREIEETPERNRTTPEAQAKLDRALGLIDGLDNGRAENQEALERMKYSLLRLSGRSGGSIETLRTFDECLLRASMEYFAVTATDLKLGETLDAAVKQELEANLKNQCAATIAAARKALALVGETTPERNRVRILNMLQRCLRRINDGPRAALVCEYLANTARQPEVAQAAASEALRLYQYLARVGGKEDAVAAQRMMAMAVLLDQRFPQSAQAAEAQSILGRDLIVKKQYDSAIALLVKIPKNQPSFASARYYAGVAAWSNHRQKNQGKLSTKSPEAIQALGFLNEAIKAFAELKSNDPQNHTMEAQAGLLIVGIHDTFGETDLVLQACAPLLLQVEQKRMPAGLSPGVEIQILETAMGAYIQKRDLQQGAAKILAVIQKRKDDPQLGNVAAFLQKTALRIRLQLDELQKQGEAAKAQYESTKQSFRQFLAQIESDPKLPASQRIWLGHSYAGIDEHGKAAAVLQAMPVPPEGSPPAEVTLYRQAMAMRVTALRQNAMAVADPNDRDKALALVEKELQGIMKLDWARRNPSLIREEILVLQNRGQFSGRTGAIARWDAFRTAVQPNLAKSETLKDLYWESTYHLAYCIFLEAQMIKDEKARAKGLERAAAIILQAKRHQYGGRKYQNQYETLLAHPKNKELKDAVERLEQSAASQAANPSAPNK